MTLGSCAIPAVLQYLDWAEAHGIARVSLLARAGIDDALLSQPEARLSGEQFQTLLLALAQMSGEDTFGLQSAQFVQPGSYSVLGYIAMNSDTLEEALERAMPFEKLVGDMGRSDWRFDQDGATLRWHCQYDHPNVVPQMVDNVLASWTGFARALLGQEDASPSWVRLRRSAPRDGGAAHRAWFGAPVQFDAKEDAIGIPPVLLKRPVVRPDPQLLPVLEQHARRRLQALEQQDDLPMRVRALIHAALETGPVRRDHIAEALGLSEKTLQRRLAQCQTQYQTELDTVRLSIAKRTLREGEQSVADLALRLGFSDVRSFQRRFKQWTGQGPGAYRQAAREEQC
ncbi:AraC family transcriptional regulator [Ferrimonas balearica]|uniref:AraC family transcriptional regulator n=1 Tax=Ferrimonas balearica TaxID=44012 RepID=UPI001C995BD2|nr:AraC family transcriptional regulator [Ferrimonas balearica]MBY5922275.1 AraC family transcriptional regulator [Ferrimonas balearica]MBY5994385.1 AraC family transcriptional regulator [Ferrimonas balearica]